MIDEFLIVKTKECSQKGIRLIIISKKALFLGLYVKYGGEHGIRTHGRGCLRHLSKMVP